MADVGKLITTLILAIQAMVSMVYNLNIYYLKINTLNDSNSSPVSLHTKILDTPTG